MSAGPRSTAPSAEVIQQASLCAIALNEAHLDEAERGRWEAWLAADESHRTAFERMSRIWGCAAQLRDIPRPSEAELALDIFEDDSFSATPTEPAAAMPIRRWSVGLVAACAASVALLIGVATFIFMQGRHTVQLYVTSVGEHREFTLPDGTVVWLGAASRMTLEYSAHSRTVNLLFGEALFNVIPDGNRVFEVKSGGGVVRDIGTVFSVHKGLQTVYVAVREGIVGITPREKSGGARLEAGEAVAYGDAVGVVQSVDTSTVGSFLKGSFAYLDVPLADVVSDVARYSNKPVHLDSSLRSTRYTGTVFVDQIPQWLAALQRAYGLKIVTSPDEIVIANAD